MRREGYEVVTDWREIRYSYSWNCCEKLSWEVRYYQEIE